MSGKPARTRGEDEARFVTGPVWRHILASTGAAAVGLMAIFAGELANAVFLSWLGDVDVLAALGYASSALFLLFAFSIAASITTGAIVAPAIGAGDLCEARRLATDSLIVGVGIVALASLVAWIAAPAVLGALGATGRSSELALAYMRTLIPTMPLLALGMCASAVLRAQGDVRRAMNITLLAAVVNVVLDPPLIFSAGLGMQGAAWATNLSRFAVVLIGVTYVTRTHRLLAWPSLSSLMSHQRRIVAFSVPVILTNFATPVGNAYVTAAMAAHGDRAVAAWALIGRFSPVAFGAIFALSAAVGPVIGQNLGARRLDRVREGLECSVMAAVGFALVAWLMLAALADPLVAVFKAGGETAELIRVFCLFLSPLYAFLGMLFVANATLNALGRPHWPTVLNWGRATVGTVPFVTLGGWLMGPTGVMLGSLIGASLFGLFGVWLTRRMILELHADLSTGPAERRPDA